LKEIKRKILKEEIYSSFFSFEEKGNTTKGKEGEKTGQQKLREIFISNVNPILTLVQKGNENGELALNKKDPVSLLYYNGNNNGVYVIVIVDESFEFQYFERKNMIFVANMVNQEKLLQKKENKGIDEDNIVQLDL